jgi:hypothetical protein
MESARVVGLNVYTRRVPDHERVVRDVLAAASLPQPKLLVRAVEGVGNHVFFAGDVVVRLGTGSDGIKFPRSAAVLAAARPSVRVPELVHIDASCSTHPVPVMVLARMPGEPLSRHFGAFDATDRRHVLEQIAIELQAVHALSPNAIPEAAFADPWWAERTNSVPDAPPPSRKTCRRLHAATRV